MREREREKESEYVFGSFLSMKESDGPSSKNKTKKFQIGNGTNMLRVVILK